MSNSSLATYTKISPNRTSPRNHTIDTISIHCAVGQFTAKEILNLSHFVNYNSSSGVSCNYAVGKDGSIGLGVEEKDRSWCTSSRSNDHRAITIEVASDTTSPYAVTDKAYKALIELLVDICKRNNIKELKWKADKSLIGQIDQQNMTVHRWFANKACPGDYLYNKHGEIAEEVNKRLGSNDNNDNEDKPLYRVRKSWSDASSQIGAFAELDNAKAMADKNKGYAVFDESGKQVYPTASTTTEKLYRVRKSWSDEDSQKGAFKDLDNAKAMADDTGYNVYDWNGKEVYSPKKTYSYKTGDYVVTCSKLNVRTGAGTNYRVKSNSELSASARKQGGYVKGVVFTALEVENLPGESWARTPSGWVCLQNEDGTYVKRK